jgi:microcystin-dependent protein
MWSGRRKKIEQNKNLYFKNQISTIFKPVQGIIPEITEEITWLLSDNDDMYNSNSGNIGVGTKTPTVKFDVSGVINTSSQLTINYVPIAPPIGSITAYTLATSPPGWLICDGTAVSRVTYAALFAVIGTTFGTGNNSTTFNLPNYQGAFLRGTGTNGVYSGPSLNTSQNHATQTHTHTANSVVNDPGHVHSQTTVNDDFNNSGGSGYPVGSNPSFAPYDSAGTRTWTNINSQSTGVTVTTTVGNSTTFIDANETRPYNFGVYWIIKY